MNWIKKLFGLTTQKQCAIHNVSTRNDDYETNKLERKFDSLKFWTPELIEWIGKENDPVKLAVASCLVNCHEWPEWLPGKPKENKDREDLFYTVEVLEMLKQKSEKIAPKLYSYIWLTRYYRSYVC